MLGILCGLESEAKIARCIENAVVKISSARTEKARESVQWLIENGATKLLSFGFAGGLMPGLPAGSLIIGSEVQAGEESRVCDLEFVNFLQQNLPNALSGKILASEKIIASKIEKNNLFQKTGCLCADMESGVLAIAAYDAGIPFAVLRAIADTADMDLPKAALVPLRDNGRVDSKGILLTILADVSQLPAILKLGVNNFLAIKSLKHAIKEIYFRKKRYDESKTRYSS